MKDKRTAENLRKDEKKHAEYLERKRRERKLRPGYEAKRKAKWRANNRERATLLRKAHHAVEDALDAGRLVRPEQCSGCGAKCAPDAHHESYEPENWLTVVWLCDGCHQAIHA